MLKKRLNKKSLSYVLTRGIILYDKFSIYGID